MAFTLGGKGYHNLTEQYTLYPGDDTQGLLLTLKLYNQIKDGNGDYQFGQLTELYLKMNKPDQQHWEDYLAQYAQFHALLKPIVIAALTHTNGNNNPDPLEIVWGWDTKSKPDMKNGVNIAYGTDKKTGKLKYHITVFGYPNPTATAERLARRAARKKPK